MSNVLKSICADKGVSTSGGTIYLGTGSKPIPVTVGKPKVLVKRPRFTIDNLKRLKTSMNLSDRQTFKVAADFRVVGGRKSVESNLSKKLVELNHLLDDLFISKAVAMKVKPKIGKDSDVELDDQGYKSLHTVGVFCKDCDSLVSEVLAKRGLVPDDTHIHCGFDSGQGILKIAVTATNKIQNAQENRRVKYRKGVAARVS